MFETQVYIDRRNTLKERFESGVILFLGNEESSINYADNRYPFRQDSTFLYYFGVNKPHLMAVLDLDENKEILFGDDSTIDEIIWTGRVSPLKDLADIAGVDEYLPFEEVKTYLKDKGRDRTIHYLPPYRPEHRLKLQEWLGLEQKQVREQTSIELIKAVAGQRSIKSKKEIQLIEEAVDISGKMHLEAIRSARPGMKEHEVMSRVHQKALELGGRPAFPIVLTKNGQTLHNHYYGNMLEEGDIILCDAGAEHAFGYAGDLSRSFPVSSRFSALQRTIYQIVLDAQMAAVDKLRPGLLFKNIHLTACIKLAEGLKDLGLMKGDSHEAVQAGAHAMFFQCGLGHMIGLDVHDMENLGEEYVGYTDEITKSEEFGLKSLRLGRTVKPGFVVTIEPGIYFIPELIDLWRKDKKHEQFINYSRLEEFRNFGGIRIEDDYVVTEEGSRLLGDPVPREISEIEELRSMT